jgi:hypothetical protein
VPLFRNLVVCNFIKHCKKKIQLEDRRTDKEGEMVRKGKIIEIEE